MKLSKTIMSLSNLELHYLVGEMQPLMGQYVQKVYGQDNLFRLKFRNADVVIQLPEKIYVSKNPPVFEDHPSSYVMLLRKHVLGRLVKIEQLNFDRIVRFEFEKGKLVFELFAKGNVILCNADNKIIKPLHNEHFASRILHAGQEYKAPPMEKKHPEKLTMADFALLKGKVVAALSKKVNFSPFFLEEACARAKVELTWMIEEVKEPQKQALISALKKMMDDYSPHKYGGVVSPICLYRLPEGKPAATFSELLETQPVLVEEEKDNKEYLQATQRKAIEDFGKLEKEASVKARWLFANFDVLESILDGEDSMAKDMGAKVVRKGFIAEVEIPDSEPS